MKSLLCGVALALVQIAPAAAANLGCWNTQSIKTNSSPSGTFKINGTTTVDYMESMNAGVTTLLTTLSPFNNGTYAICFDGTKTTVSGKKVWRLDVAVICPFTRIQNNFCAS